jgi:hypothetical protein
LFDDTAVGSGGLDEVMPIDLVGSFVRIVVTTTGTTAANTFTVDNSALELVD